MELSYWELKHWLKAVDFTIVGSGITGLNCALALREKYPKANIIILEKGLFPQGASTKNAGFACFGSVSELLDDLNSQSEEEMVTLVRKRSKGLGLLRKTLGDTAINYKHYGGYEIFLRKQEVVYEKCLHQIERINTLLKPSFKNPVFKVIENSFGFKNTLPQLIKNDYEGQLDTGKMMLALLKKAISSDIRIVNGITFKSFSEEFSQVHIKTDQFTFKTQKLFIATNGFASELGIESVKPARAQVLITNKIKDLSIKGTFHLEEGYYYFRNIDQRILLGGGRNLDKEGETTTALGLTDLIQEQLEKLLEEVILPDTTFEVAHRWSGIMGVGSQKKPILKMISPRVFCGVRLGGMGVAIGSLTGKELAAFAD
ncbi:NAD(P)/FAD-dependent oxidoreductase [Ascidiimonas sp. W6]|uniref:NAD(P)/FAD-dependent oxidoreductase n=1 Tax=Ascidiimonas meishanensis TaxID=3128903 RepID=UPI0030EE62B4